MKLKNRGFNGSRNSVDGLGLFQEFFVFFFQVSIFFESDMYQMS